MSERRLQDTKTSHPWWSAPGSRIEMLQFDNYHSLVSSEWKGREREWFASIMRIGTITYYGSEITDPSILELYPTNGFDISKIIYVGDYTDNGTWSISAIVESEERKRDLLVDLTERGVTSDSVAIMESPNRQLDMIGCDSIDIVYDFGSMSNIRSKQLRQEFWNSMLRIIKPDGILVSSFHLRLPSVHSAIMRSDTWITADELNELILFSNPSHYGDMRTPSVLEDIHYTSMEAIEELFANSNLDMIDVVPCDAIWRSLGDDAIKKLVDLGESAVNMMCTAVAIVQEANMSSCLSPEVLCVGRKAKNLSQSLS